MGIHNQSFQQLASTHLAYAYARLSTVRTESWWPPLHERVPTYDQCGVPVLRTSTDDRSPLAQCFCSNTLCDSSAARGVGRLDCGAQGCVECCFFHADPH